MKNSLADVQYAVCVKFQVFPAQLLAKNKGCKNVYIPRMIGMYLAREFTGRSHPAIGRWFNRDHTTSMSAHRRVSEMLSTDPKIKAHVDELASVLPKMVQTRQEAIGRDVGRLLAGEVSWPKQAQRLPPASF